MTLRRRLALVAAAAVAIAIALASGIVYVVVRGELRGQLDSELRQVSERRNLGFVLRPPGPAGEAPSPMRAPGAPRDALGLQTTYVGAVLEDGTRLRPPGADGAAEAADRRRHEGGRGRHAGRGSSATPTSAGRRCGS